MIRTTFITATALVAMAVLASPAAAQLTRDDDDGRSEIDPVFENPSLDCPTEPLGTVEDDERFGRAVAVGDFNGNGYADLAVGAPRLDAGGFWFTDAGAVFIYHGFPSGASWEDPAGGVHERVDFMPWERLNQYDVNNDGPKKDDFLGQALVSGDFNGDGYDDLAMGAPGMDSPVGILTGMVFIGWGSANGLTDFERIAPSDAGILPTGIDQFGAALATGDFDGDGRDDLAIGSPGYQNGDGINAGHVRLMLGSDDGLVAWTGVHQEMPQTAVTPAGAGTGLPLGTHEYFDGFGASLAIGDLDDDGRDDLVVGTPSDQEGAAPSGAVYVFQSAAEGMRGWARLDQTGMDANEAGDAFGYSVAIGNFKTGSPYTNEIIVGAPAEDIEEANIINTGRIYAFENQGGVITGLYGLYQTGVSDNTAYDAFGHALLAYKMLGSHWMLLVSAPGDNRNGNTNAGEVLPFYPTGSGPTDAGGGNPGESTWIYGDEAYQYMGRSMAVGGPSNTIVIGHDRNASESGGVWYKRTNESVDHLYQDSMNLPASCE